MQYIDKIEEKTDNEIIVLIRQDPDFLSYIIDRYTDRLDKYISRRTKVDKHEKEDILQDIFIKVYLNINEFDNSLIFSSWIYRIAHNYIIDWYRKNKKHQHISIDDEENKLIHFIEDENQDFNNNEILIIKENTDMLKKEIENLSKDYQEVLMLKFFEDKSYEEISDILKISINSVGVKINRAKKILKNKLKLKK